MPGPNDTCTGRGHFPVTQSDTAAFPEPLPRALHFGTAGTYVVTDEYGVDAPYKVVASYRLDLRCLRVKVTGSNVATDIVAMR